MVPVKALPLLLVSLALLLLPSLAADLGTEGDDVTMTPLQLEEAPAGPKLTPEELEAALDEGLRRFERHADRWTRQTSEHWQSHLSEVLDNFQREPVGEKRDRQRRDSAGVTDQLWHSYRYNTGVGNREELSLHGFYSGLQLNVTGPALDGTPQWQVVSHRGVFFLFGLYPFAGTTKLHIVKTDFKGMTIQRTVNFTAADLRVTPFLHHLHSTQGARLFAFVKRAAPVAGLYSGDEGRVSEQVFCFSVDQETLRTTEVCSPITLPPGAGTAQLLVTVLLDSYTGSEMVALLPVRQKRGLAVYRLSEVPYSDSYNLGLHSSIQTNSSVWKVRTFSVSGSTYVVITYGQGPVERMVQVFRHDSGVFSLVQTVPVKNFVIDIEVFDIGFQHYLALGQESQTSLYVWHYDQFQLLQQESSSLTYKWTVVAVKSCRHEVILAKVFNAAGYQVEFYRHNVQTQSFEVVSSVPCVNGAQNGTALDCFRHPDDVLDLSELVGVTADDATYIVVPSKAHQLLLVTVNATVDFAPDPVWLQSQRLLARQAELKAKYESLLAKERRLQNVLSRVVVPDSDQVLTGDFNFQAEVTADTLEAPDAAFNSVRMEGYPGDALGLVAPLTELDGKVKALELAINNASDKLTDVVRADAPSITISGPKVVAGAVTIESLIGTGPVHISMVKGIALNSTLSNMVRIDSSRLISGTKTLTADGERLGALSVASELTATRLNGRPVSDIVTRDTVQEISGPLTYGVGALSVDTLSVDGLVGGVDTSRLALYGGDGKLPVPVSIARLDVTNLTVSQLNSQPPEELFSNVLLNSGGTFTDAVTFEGEVTLTDVTVNGTLNGEDAADCLSSVLFTDSDQTLDALWLSTALVTGPLSPQTVNSKPFPGGRYVTAGGSHVISGKKIFTRAVVANVTAARVDGVPVTQFVTLDTDQTVTSLAVTASHVLGSLSVGGRIDGVAVAPGWLDHLLTNGSQTVDADVVFSGGVSLLGNLRASSVNGGSVERLFGGLIVPEEGQSMTVRGRKRFTGAVTADAVTVGGLVNEVDPRDWLTKSGDQLVIGPLTITGHGYFASMVVAGTIDGVDITSLMQEAIYTDAEEEQLIYGVKAFANPSTMSSLIVDGTINSLTSSKILWTTGTQTITGPHAYLGSVRAGGLHAYGDVLVPEGARIGGIDFSELPAMAAKATNDTHTETLVFDKVVVRGDILTDRLNGIDLKNLSSKILRRDGGRITGRWRFESLLVNGSITSSHGSAGYHLSQLHQRAISLSRGSTLTAPLTLERLVVERGGAVSGRVELAGTTWEEVLENLVSEQRPIVINASKTFLGGLHVIGSLQSPSLPLQNLLLVGADQTVTGPAYFHSDVTVHKAMTVRRPINGRYDVTQIERLFVVDADDVTINGDLVIEGEASISSLNISGLLAGLPVSSLLSSSVPLSSSPALSGHLTFLSPAHVPTLHLSDGALNGRDLAKFLNTVRLVTEDQVFEQPVEVGAVTLKTAEVQRMIVEGLVNGINCSDVFQRLIYLDRHHVFRGLWTLPSLSVAGDLSLATINGQLPGRLLRLDGTEALGRLNVTGEVHTTEVRNGTAVTRLNGWNVWREVGSRFRLSSPAPQTLLGSLAFTGRVTINGDVLLGGRLGGLNTSQLVVLGDDSHVLANVQFRGPVTADRVLVRGPVDGVNFSRCAGSAVYPGRDHTLRGQYAVATVEIEGFSSRQPFDVDQAQEEVNDLLEQCESEQRDFEDFYRSQCQSMRGLYADMRSTYYAVRYFDVLQELTWPGLGSVLSTLVIEDDTGASQILVTYTRLPDNCPESQLLRWSVNSSFLHPSGAPFSSGAVRQWRHLRPGGRDLLVSAAQRAPPGCASPLSTVWSWGGGRVEPLQSLDIASTQVFYTVPRPGVPAQLRLLSPAEGLLRQFSYSPKGFVMQQEAQTDADLLAVHSLPDASLLLLSAEGTTVVARRLSPQQATLHAQTLGSLTARAFLTFVRRGQTLFAVGDGGWSSLVNSPQGVKIFEYFGNGTHRCVPEQHLAAVSPTDLALFTAGSLPDLYLVTVESGAGLRVFIDKGEAGFVEFQRVSVPGADSVVVLRPAQDSPPHLLVSSGRRLVLLQARMMGAHVRPVEVDCQPPGEGGVEGRSGGEGEERELEGRFSYEGSSAEGGEGDGGGLSEGRRSDSKSLVEEEGQDGKGEELKGVESDRSEEQGEVEERKVEGRQNGEGSRLDGRRSDGKTENGGESGRDLTGGLQSDGRSRVEDEGEVTGAVKVGNSGEESEVDEEEDGRGSGVERGQSDESLEEGGERDGRSRVEGRGERRQAKGVRRQQKG